ncbi:4-hydroxyphenylacetate 3-monooxygenase, oxygenase subunit [Caldalkalibacillus thermarum TA2.A1]|uniref:4-hydroxyphenylacetate 3-monooxygenase, oxygenase component n=1 Tax=Caldalkalibacillus thermarum (strain TA2.A1) TaxID=986075 RepID=F5L6B3_CALTT|nr:4-hydroxyphenylacetate 3-monooxygenase, oxygenase component [Caldalkalibacillus thermarum]EGL83113.1 4-hydroxyphenylacetate 3-monooxygenase, oxygenase subunit [Caldalkalibacillus thermarum TA2.A1]QZT32472.1 4-hydroxyphenylacetate 3-monooxygenase, oxygenase component [Caldalkalibacillus thermarum TA2.A1]
MPARTGKEYIEGLKKAKNNVWIHGEKVEDVTEHPAFKNVVNSVAELYDLQYEKPEKMLYTSPTTGDQVGLSFIQPKTKEDLIRRREMIMEWARYTGGMMGRSPDYLNTSIMAFGSAESFFAQADPMFGKNARNYYEYVRENDISLTHTLIHPQVNRSKIQAEQKDPYLSARIVEKNADGIVIRGCRLLATLGGITDEIVVFPSTINKMQSADDPYAIAFAIPNNTPGLKFLCRESFDYGRSKWDHPLGARFEESDAIVVFDDVLVPWERVFICENSDICNRAYRETNAVVHMAHQVVAKNVAKTEFTLGVILSIIDAIGIERFQHVKEKAYEVMSILETMRSHLYRAEENAQLDQYGVMTPDFIPLDTARNWYPRMYPRIVEIIRILGASGLMAIPTEADFNNEEIGELIHRYTQGANIDGYERVQLFRLAWDICISAFGNRQVLYEYYFFGDPVRMSNAFYDHYNKDPYKEMVKEFLERTKSSAPKYV